MITRPAHQAGSLSRLVEQAGGRAIELPLIEITTPADESAARDALAGLAEFDMVIFISPNAVQRSRLYIGNTLPDGPRLAVVGQGTARQLQEDFQRRPDLIPSEGYNSEALLALPACRQLGGKRILIVKGEGGRSVLADGLVKRGALVSYANLYRRVVPAAAKAQLATVQNEQKVDVVVLTSGEGIANLLSLTGETSRTWLCNMPWLVIHPRLADIARQAGCENEIIVSEGAGDEQILHCLRQWVQHKPGS